MNMQPCCPKGKPISIGIFQTMNADIIFIKFYHHQKGRNEKLHAIAKFLSHYAESLTLYCCCIPGQDSTQSLYGLPWLQHITGFCSSFFVSVHSV